MSLQTRPYHRLITVSSAVILLSIALYGTAQERVPAYPDLEAVWKNLINKRGDFVWRHEAADTGFRLNMHGSILVYSVGRDHVVFQDALTRTITIRPFTQIYVETPVYYQDR
jgi:hypothetical protein